MSLQPKGLCFFGHRRVSSERHRGTERFGKPQTRNPEQGSSGNGCSRQASGAASAHAEPHTRAQNSTRKCLKTRLENQRERQKCIFFST